MKRNETCSELFQFSEFYNFLTYVSTFRMGGEYYSHRRALQLPCNARRNDRQAAQKCQHIVLSVPGDSQSCQAAEVKFEFEIFHALGIKRQTRIGCFDCPCS